MGKYDSPGVYIIEKNSLPMSISAVDTAVPVFIGYTEKNENELTGESYDKKVIKVNSMIDYIEKFGKAPIHPFTVEITQTENETTTKILETKIKVNGSSEPTHLLYYSMRIYFDNGGGPCYVMSVSKTKNEDTSTTPSTFTDRLVTSTDLDLAVITPILEAKDEPTLIVVPDSVRLGAVNHGSLAVGLLAHCNKMQDRFLITDVPNAIEGGNTTIDNINDNFRNRIASLPANLKYGAAYYPYLETNIDFETADSDITISAHTINKEGPNPTALTPITAGTNIGVTAIKNDNPLLYNQILTEVRKKKVVMPPSAAIAGIYCAVDNAENVWVAPANVGINRVVKPAIEITSDYNGDLNVDSSGKSVNAIRTFTGRGTLVWGARTLNAADLNWRFVNVRRMVTMIEISIKKILELYVFSPNTANTWVKVQSMISSFLDSIWKEGGLAGAVAQDAFEVHIGLNTTMTPMEVAQGIMNVEIILVPPRPAEVIKLIVSQKLQVS